MARRRKSAALETNTAWYNAPRALFTGGNRVRLLRGGEALFPEMLDAIGHSRHEIWLASYIFHNDDDALRIADALAAAAQRGVRVRVVVDGFGSKATLPDLDEILARRGVGLAVFRPVGSWWSWLQPGQLRRMHHKLCVVDGDVAFVGGINIIGDHYDLRHGSSDAPRLDYAVALRGPAVVPVEQTARAMWTRATLGHEWHEGVLALTRSAEPLARARRVLGRLRIRPSESEMHDAAESLAPVRAAFVVRDNLRQRRAIERSYVDAIRAAHTRVELVSPYFYPGHRFRRALRQAAQRGVRVRLLLQGKLDYRIAGVAASVLYDELLAHGVHIHEYTPAFLHAKVAMVDDDWATVGSSNIDPLSLLLNLEANVVVHDAPFAAQVAHELDIAIADSRKVLAPPYATGWLAVLRRTFVASVAHWFLRMAGINGRY